MDMDPLKAIPSLAAASSLAFSLAGCMLGRAPSTVTVDRGYESVYLALSRTPGGAIRQAPVQRFSAK